MRTHHALAAVLTAFVTLLLVARPAAACRCEEPTLATSAARADAVFAGEVVAVEPPAGRVQRLTVAVDAVWKGDVAARVVIETPATSCGLVTLGARVGRHLLFAVRGAAAPDTFKGQQCEGTRPLPPARRPHAEHLLGAPHPPR